MPPRWTDTLLAVKCPTCGGEFNPPLVHAGKLGMCTCGTKFKIPGPPADTPAISASETPTFVPVGNRVATYHSGDKRPLRKEGFSVLARDVFNWTIVLISIGLIVHGTVSGRLTGTVEAVGGLCVLMLACIATRLETLIRLGRHR